MEGNRILRHRPDRRRNFYVGSNESLDRRRGIVGDHSEAYTAGARIEIFGVLASRLGLVGVAINHLDGHGDEDFAGIVALEKGFAFAEGNFRLIDFDDALQGIAIRVDHRPAQLLSQQPSGLVSDAELILQLPRRHAVGMCRHEMCRPEPRGQRQLGTMHHRSRRGRSLSTAIEAFVCVSPALQRIVGTIAAHLMFSLPVVEFSQKVRFGGAQWFAELVATFGLLVTILAGIRFAQNAVPWLVGLYITAAYWFTASTSFANPAVAIARCFTNTFAGIRPVDLPGFIIAEMFGAIVALALMGWLLIPREERAISLQQEAKL